MIDYDAMFPWVNEAEFGQQNALRAINISDLSNAMHGELDLSGVTPAENVVANVADNIIPIVSAHPETTFVFFIPPYPVIHWSTKLSGNINQELINTKYIWEQMNNYDNTQFHMLQFMDNTTNLFLYKDSLHYNYRMGEDVPAALKSMKYIVNSDNAEDMFDRFYHYVEDFDYSIYTGEKYPFQSTTDFSQYISEISDERYIKLLLGSGSVGTLNDEEEAILYANNLLPDDYSRGDFFYVSDKEAYNSFDIEYNYETDDAKASVLVDKIDYVPEYMGITESKMLVIVVIDSETGRVVDVAGLRESTRDLIKY